MEEMKRVAKESSLKLYAQNVRRLNGNQEIVDYDFLKDTETILQKLEKYSFNTKRTYLIAIVATIKQMSDLVDAYKIYNDIITKMNNASKVNVLKTDDQKDNWMTQDEILSIYKQLEEKVLPIFKEKKLNEKEFKLLSDFLLLSLYVLQDPRRNKDYSLMKVVKKMPKSIDTNFNYLDLSSKEFVFNEYKTSSTYHTQKIPISDNLYNLLGLFCKKFHPLRKQKDPYFLLTDYDGIELKSPTEIQYILNRIFGKKVGICMLRNIFITSKFRDTSEELRETAKNMGTSVNMLVNIYAKMD